MIPFALLSPQRDTMATITIDAPVGLRNRTQQVTNKANDQQKIIDLLGGIPADKGGKQEAWDDTPPLPGPDGNCPKPLADAIFEFQIFWRAKGLLAVADSVVDPGKSSLRKMNEQATAAAPTTFLQRVYGLVHRAIARQRSAIATLAMARIAVDAPTTSDLNKAALDLVNRCFKIFEATGSDVEKKASWRTDIDMIVQVYTNGVAFLTDARVNEYFIELSDADIRVKAGQAANACTNPGCWTKKDPTDGIWLNKDVCPPHNNEWLLDALTHEFAHFCGPLPPTQVKDLGYGDAALALPRERAQKNAANHAWFAGLSQTPSANWPGGTYPS